MMNYKVTALKAQKRNPNRVNVYLDGEYAFGLSRIVAAWLQVGRELSDDQVQSLQQKDADEVAFQAALRLLNLRARSETEIRDRLVKKGFSESAIEGVLERLRQAQLIDDEQFAQAWVENQTTFRPRGRRALRLELRQKGINDEVIQKTLEETTDEESLAYQAAEKAARRWSQLEWQEFRVKLVQFLARRGFSYGTAAPIVRRIWEEMHSDDTLAEAGDPHNIDD
jgi:regulatory protein